MIRQLSAIVLFAAMVVPAAAGAQPATTKPAAPALYTTTDTDIGTLLDDPAAKAVLDRVLPGFATNPQIELARSMTMRSIQQYASETLTDAKLAEVDAEFAKLAGKK